MKARRIAKLLAWYDRHGRRGLPWRAATGIPADPYRVWISEIMLQQTTVAAVGPYFRAFIARWPTVEALAAAPLDDVLHAWQGLGYYARARNLHAAAQAVVARHGGRFPDRIEALAALPGIGAYTAAAVAAIAFGVAATPVDGNVVRVLARLHGIATPLPQLRREIVDHAASLAPAVRPGDFAQALMDLGATICTPRHPRCELCPWQDDCVAHASGRAEVLPVAAPRRTRPNRYGVAFWIERPDGRVLLRRRPAKGLLGGMMEVPTTPWRAEPWPMEDAITVATPSAQSWQPLAGTVEHAFTHFALTLAVLRGQSNAPAADGDVWVNRDGLAAVALPTLFRKVVALAGGRPGVTNRRQPAM